MLIIGDKEAEQKSVSIRLRDGSMHNNIAWEEAHKIILKTIKDRKLQAEMSQPTAPT